MENKFETISDYMVPLSDYPHVDYDTTLHEAVRIMNRMAKEKGYRWLVVLDDSGSIAGFLTLRNVFEAISNLAPRAGSMLGFLTSLNRQDLFYLEGVQLIKDTPLKKIIKPMINVSVHENDAPGKAVGLILSKRITITPVINDHNQVVGIVRPVDLLPFIIGLFENAPAK